MVTFTNYDRALFVRKRIALSALLMIITAVFGFLLLPRVSAGATDFAKKLMQDIVDMICGAQLKECKEIMLGENSMFMDAAVTGVGVKLANTLKGVGTLLAIIYALIGLLRNMTKGDFTMRSWAQFLVMLAVSLTVLLYLDTIITWIEDLGKAIVNGFVDDMLEFDLTKEWEELKAAGNLETSSASGGTSGIWKTLEESLNNTGEAIDSALSNNPVIGGIYNFGKDALNLGKEAVGWLESFWDSVYMSMQLMFPWLVFRLLNLYTKTISYALFFELAVRRVFMPVAVANILNQGFRSPGVEYLKKYLAVFVKMAIILVSLAIAWNMVLSTITRYCTNVSDLFVGLSGGIYLGALGTAIASATGGQNVAQSGFINIWDCIMLVTAAHMLMKKAGDYAGEVMGSITVG